MKPIWVGVVFFIVYGMFTMKSQAAEVELKSQPVLAGSECR